MPEWMQTILTWLTELGYWGVFIGLVIEIIPSEIPLAYAGYLVSKGHLDFTWAVVVGTIGGVLAQLFIYWVARYGGRPFLKKYGKYVFIHERHIDVAEKWFNRYGTGVIFTARFIPVVRHAISIPAGIAKMPMWQFTMYTTLAVIPWSAFFIYLGLNLGDNWDQIDDKAGAYIQAIIWVSVGLTALYVLYKLWSIKREKNRKHRLDANYGEIGEEEVAHQLKFVGDEYVVLHNRRVRNGNASQQIDHLVIGPNGLFHIETKYWSGEITFTKNGVQRSKGESADPTGQLYRHEHVLKGLLREHKLACDVVGIVCFAHPDSRIHGKIPAFHALKPERLVHFIKTYKPNKKMNEQQLLRTIELLRIRSEPS